MPKHAAGQQSADKARRARYGSPSNANTFGAERDGFQNIRRSPNTTVDVNLKFGRVEPALVQLAHHLNEDFNATSGSVELSSSVVAQDDACMWSDFVSHHGHGFTYPWPTRSAFTHPGIPSRRL